MSLSVTENVQLDTLASRSDALKGDAILKKVFDFLGRFVAYPSDHARVAHALWCGITFPRPRARKCNYPPFKYI
jgi:hypothetical protein